MEISEMPQRETFRFLGTTDIDVVTASGDTGGCMTVFTERAPAGYGPPPHIHVREVEHLVPIDGTFERFDGKAWHHIPREGFSIVSGSIHTWRNAGKTDATIMCVFTPGGFENVMRAVADMSLEDDADRIVDIARRAGTILLLEPDQ